VARGRRLITFRTLLFVILLGAVVYGALAAVRWYDTNSYFVGVNHNELIIYQGRIGGFLWYKPQVVDRTAVTTADVPSRYLPNLQAGVEESSVDSARTYVSNLKATRACELNPSSLLCVTPPTSVVPSTASTKGT
jgi:protein phosphatase